MTKQASLSSTNGIDAPIVAISCSPRAGGNSDNACKLFMEGVTAAGGTARMVLLRHYDVHHCVSCHRCERDPAQGCYLSEKDQSNDLFRILLTAPVIFFASPIYFYHVPSHFKAFIDRCQCFWMRYQAGESSITGLPPRKAFLAMMGARPRGEKLFEGSVLTLKCFLQPFNFTLQQPLLMYGLDGPRDLVNNDDDCENLRRMGMDAQKAVEEYLAQNKG
ncbi:flavodoxin family protein [Desulfovibrio mangrovi]|uniref:flavodoxin family protein n=1 Tax=Desulfovibrio mangrovi TaxID=2976983 RepID=UPI0022477C6D|nr:NAD(P)H-dependent oxidoreductase [Desulfovibrio mangrovi]UZP68961.1 flavodoxin family protein [Desulfovibrio mangrovi]